MSLVIAIATCCREGWTLSARQWQRHALAPPELVYVRKKELIVAYQDMFEATYQDVIGYVHDDAYPTEYDWDVRVMAEFEDPKVGIVGFGGSWGHGNPSMYKVPYKLPNLARIGFRSNMTDAEKHGSRFTGECDVAALDGFALFVRREVLEKAGGWPQDGTVGYYLYSEWATCMARRLGYKIRLVGVACEHLGGRSTGLNPNAKFDFEGEHRWLYDNFSDVLPAEVPR